MSGRANIGSVPCFRGSYPAEDDNERVSIDCSTGQIGIAILSDANGPSSPMYKLEGVAARALAALLLTAADTLDGLADRHAQTVAAAYAAKRSR
jgi:hypothetical protein